MSSKINFSTIDDISRRALSDYFFAVSCAAEISVSMKDKIKTCDEDILKAKSALDVNSNANTLAAYNAALRVKAAMKRSIAKEIKEAKDLKDSALALIPDSLYEVYLSMGNLRQHILHLRNFIWIFWNPWGLLSLQSRSSTILLTGYILVWRTL